eukprot:364168-Chlamydomonas_euryale.AAC.2
MRWGWQSTGGGKVEEGAGAALGGTRASQRLLRAATRHAARSPIEHDCDRQGRVRSGRSAAASGSPGGVRGARGRMAKRQREAGLATPPQRCCLAAAAACATVAAARAQHRPAPLRPCALPPAHLPRSPAGLAALPAGRRAATRRGGSHGVAQRDGAKGLAARVRGGHGDVVNAAVIQAARSGGGGYQRAGRPRRRSGGARGAQRARPDGRAGEALCDGLEG